MEGEKYYSKRNGFNNKAKIYFDSLINFFDDIINDYEENDCFYKLYEEIDSEFTLFSIEKFGKDYLLPYSRNNIKSEDDIFDLIELFYKYISKPTETSVIRVPIYMNLPTISEDDLPIEYKERKEKEDSINDEDYRLGYRKRINRIISKYEEGFYLNELGEVQKEVSSGLKTLINSEIQVNERLSQGDEHIADEIEQAKGMFLHHSATVTDKRNALIVLGRVLEEKRKDIKKEFMSKDESELFQLLNQYNIRHSDLSQKKDYPTEIYFDWMLYNLLAAIDTYYKIANRND